MELGAVVISVDEPQLDRCLASVWNQNGEEFTEIIHVNNVFPQVEAYKQALEQVNEEWSAWIGGDFILYDDAIQRMREYIARRYPDEKTFMYNFGLYDPFLDQVIGNCSVRRNEVFKKYPEKDRLSNDIALVRELEVRGFNRYRPIKEGVIVGTHFDSPSNGQVFRRFYMRGIKVRVKTRDVTKYRSILTRRYKETGKNQYKLALEAFEKGLLNDDFKRSHDIQFERGLSQGWKIQG